MNILNTILPYFQRPTLERDDKHDEATAILRCAVDEMCAAADEIVSGFVPQKLMRHERLVTLASTGLLEVDDEAAFDCFTRLICLSLNVPQSYISLVAEDRVVFLSKRAPPEWDDIKTKPIEASLCPFVVGIDRPLIIPDAVAVKSLANHPAVKDNGVRAYLGLPITVSNGETVGTLCAVDVQPRVWTPQELETVEQLTKLVTMLIDIRRRLREADYVSDGGSPAP